MSRRAEKGTRISCEGSLKLPDFEPDNYTDVFLFHFVRFLMLTNEDSAELERAQRRSQRAAKDAEGRLQEGAPMNTDDDPGRENDGGRVEGESRPAGDGGQVEGHGAGAEADPNVGAQVESTNSAEKPTTAPASSRRRRSKRSTRKQRKNIDAHELTDDETSEESDGPQLDDDDEDEDGDEDEQEVPLARVLRERQRELVRARRSSANIPIDEYGVPLHDAKGREFSSFLRDRLSRMRPETRESLLDHHWQD
ncbi:hypothetical protein EV715DRAFT_297418 [Schizophyllum commune]